jgi:PST family polysaccharide transporter
VADLRRLLGFGLTAGGGDLALYARLNADYTIAGRRLGSEALGVYTLAWSAAAGPGLLINAAFGGAGYASFARLQGDRPRLRAVYLSATRLLAALSLPVFAGALLLRAELVSVLYGAQWQGMIGPLAALFILQAVREVCRPGAGLTLALGHSRIYAAAGLVMLPLTIAAVLLGSRWGITGVAWAMLGAVGGATLLWPALACVFLRVRPATLLRTLLPPLLLLVCTAAGVGAARSALLALGAPAILRLVLAIAAGALTFFAAAWLCRRPLRADLACLRERLPDALVDAAPSDGAPRGSRAHGVIRSAASGPRLSRRARPARRGRAR